MRLDLRVIGGAGEPVQNLARHIEHVHTQLQHDVDSPSRVTLASEKFNERPYGARKKLRGMFPPVPGRIVGIDRRPSDESSRCTLCFPGPDSGIPRFT